MNPPPETTPDDWEPYDEYEEEDEKARSLPDMEETKCNCISKTTLQQEEFPDREVKEYAANVIAEYIQAQVDYEGFTITMMGGIINHDRDVYTAVHIKISM
eukprot:4983076-Ditylum_brightwellii.AAC.1